MVCCLCGFCFVVLGLVWVYMVCVVCLVLGLVLFSCFGGLGFDGVSCLLVCCLDGLGGLGGLVWVCYFGLCSDEFEFSIITRLLCWLFGDCCVWVCLLLGLVVDGGFWCLILCFVCVLVLVVFVMDCLW